MAYSYYRSITIDDAKVPNTNQTNFPVAFFGTYAGAGGTLDLRTVGNGGKVQNANGYDIAFFSNSGLTTALDFELVSYNATTGAVEFHVRIPTLTTSGDTVIYIAYGDAGISTYQGNTAGTWNSDFKGVWHLGQTSGTSLPDSTTNGYNLTNKAAGEPNPSSSGVMSGGQDFDGTDDYSQDTTAFTGLTAMTYEAWLNMDGAGANNLGRIMHKGSGAVGIPSLLTNSGKGLRLEYGWSGGTAVWITADNTVTYSTYQHVAVTYNNGASTNDPIFYLNGSAVAITSDNNSSGTPATDDTTFILGNRGGLDRAFDGRIDEARVSSVIRSADWIKTEYNNISSPTTFYTLGSESDNVSAGPIPRRQLIIQQAVHRASRF